MYVDDDAPWGYCEFRGDNPIHLFPCGEPATAVIWTPLCAHHLKEK